MPARRTDPASAFELRTCSVSVPARDKRFALATPTTNVMDLVFQRAPLAHARAVLGVKRCFLPNAVAFLPP